MVSRGDFTSLFSGEWLGSWRLAALDPAVRASALWGDVDVIEWIGAFDVRWAIPRLEGSMEKHENTKRYLPVCLGRFPHCELRPEVVIRRFEPKYTFSSSLNSLDCRLCTWERERLL